MNNGIHANTQCNISLPSRPPIAGINFFGNVDIASIILGKRPLGSLTESKIETSIVIVGGYNKGAGSNVAGIVRGNGDFHGVRELRCRNSRSGYKAIKPLIIRI